MPEPLNSTPDILHNDVCMDTPMTSQCSNAAPARMLANSAIQISISEPPYYKKDKYELRRKELRWWEGVNSGVTDQQLCAILEMKSERLMKTLMIKFVENTRSNFSTRNLVRLIEFLDGHLSKSAHELTIDKVGVWSTISKRAEETYRSFRLRCD